MSDNRTIQVAIQHLAGTHDSDTVYAMDAVVESVDQSTRTCVVTVVAGRVANQIPDVRLMATVDDGILCIPTIGSNVTILVSTYSDPYITSFSSIDSIILRGGDLGGLVKLLIALSSFNQLEKDLNNLKNLISGWAPISGDGGAALKTILTSWFSTKLTITKRIDLENTAITQG